MNKHVLNDKHKAFSNISLESICYFLFWPLLSVLLFQIILEAVQTAVFMVLILSNTLCFWLILNLMHKPDFMNEKLL